MCDCERCDPVQITGPGHEDRYPHSERMGVLKEPENVKVTQAPMVISALLRLGKEIERAQLKAENIESKLYPVLLPAGTMPERPAPEGYPVELAEAIRRHAAALEEVNDRLDNLLDRIEV